jgi:hypothetical protein
MVPERDALLLSGARLACFCRQRPLPQARAGRGAFGVPAGDADGPQCAPPRRF